MKGEVSRVEVEECRHFTRSGAKTLYHIWAFMPCRHFGSKVLKRGESNVIQVTTHVEFVKILWSKCGLVCPQTFGLLLSSFLSLSVNLVVNSLLTPPVWQLPDCMNHFERGRRDGERTKKLNQTICWLMMRSSRRLWERERGRVLHDVTLFGDSVNIQSVCCTYIHALTNHL